MSMTIKQLRYFLAVVETGKVTEAALSICISPSAVTEAIKGLESILDVALFVRTRTGLELTQEGFRFLGHAKRIIADVESAKQSILDNNSEIEGEINIGVSFTVAGYFLAGLMKGFRRSYPKVKINVIEESRVDIEKKLIKNELDIAVLLVSNIKSSKNFNSLPLLKSERRLWTSADHPFAARDIVSLAEISNEPYLQLLIDEAEHTTQQYWKKYKLQPNVIFRTLSIEAVRSLVANGNGVTILSDMVHRPWSLDGDKVETVQIKEDIPSMDTGLVWTTKNTKNEMQKHFINFCRHHYSSSFKR